MRADNMAMTEMSVRKQQQKRKMDVVTYVQRHNMEASCQAVHCRCIYRPLVPVR